MAITGKTPLQLDSQTITDLQTVLGIGQIDITYEDLVTAIDGNSLVPGASYCITDYKTVHWMVESDYSASFTYITDPSYASGPTNITITPDSALVNPVTYYYMAIFDDSMILSISQPSIEIQVDIGEDTTELIFSCDAFPSWVSEHPNGGVILFRGTEAGVYTEWQGVTSNIFDIVNYSYVLDTYETYISGKELHLISNEKIIVDGPTEPLIVFAISTNNIATDAYSREYPEDKLQYKLSAISEVNTPFYDFDNTTVVSGYTGHITYRENTTNNLKAPLDWRVFTYRLWDINQEEWLPVEYENGAYVNSSEEGQSTKIYRSNSDIEDRHKQVLMTLGPTLDTTGSATISIEDGPSEDISIDVDWERLSLAEAAKFYVNSNALIFDFYGIVLNTTGVGGGDISAPSNITIFPDDVGSNSVTWFYTVVYTGTQKRSLFSVEATYDEGDSTTETIFTCDPLLDFASSVMIFRGTVSGTYTEFANSAITVGIDIFNAFSEVTVEYEDVVDYPIFQTLGSEGAILFSDKVAGVGFMNNPTISTVLGDLTGIVTNDVPASEGVAQVDSITLSGTSGQAEVELDVYTYNVFFDVSLADTAGHFVEIYAADFLNYGITITSNGSDIVFTANATNTPFVSPIIRNIQGNLTGTVETLSDSYTVTTRPAASDRWDYIMDVPINPYVSYNSSALFNDVPIVDNSYYIDSRTFATGEGKLLNYDIIIEGPIFSNILPFITFLSDCNTMTFGQYCNNMTFELYCNTMTFGLYCENMTFARGCETMTFGQYCNTMTFGRDCYIMTFGERCETMTFEQNCDGMTFGQSCNTMTFGLGCYTMTFGERCSSMTFGQSCNTMIFGQSCNDITFGQSCNTMTFRQTCYTMTFGERCESMTFGQSCYTMIFGQYCGNMIFEQYCNVMTFGRGCGNMIFEQRCSSMTFGQYCNAMIFGQYCDSMTFGQSCYTMTFGQGCYTMIFGQDCYNNKFEDLCGGLDFTNATPVLVASQITHQMVDGDMVQSYMAYINGTYQIVYGTDLIGIGD